MTSAGDAQIYRDLMRLKPDGLSPNAWAVRAGVSRTVWADMRRHGNPSRRTLERLLASAGSSLAEFEALRIGPARPEAASDPNLVGDLKRSWLSAPTPPLPLLASGAAGEWGEPGSRIDLTEIRPTDVIERLPRPHGLAGDPDAFALAICGGSMWPRFSLGRRIAVAPRMPVEIGDDVLVRLRRTLSAGTDGSQLAMIKQLAARADDGVELRQFNPDRTFFVPTGEIETMLKIAGELI